jgi:hypothetical protein
LKARAPGLQRLLFCLFLPAPSPTLPRACETIRFPGRGLVAAALTLAAPTTLPPPRSGANTPLPRHSQASNDGDSFHVKPTNIKTRK